MRSAVGYRLILLILSGSTGCANLGSLSPLRPIEQAALFAPGAPSDRVSANDGGIDAWLKTADGVRLHGRYFSHPQPRAVALFCHGNAGSVDNWAEVGRELQQQHQMSVLVFDYRGYGRSAGRPTEAGILLDGRAARTWLAHEAGVLESEIVLIGRSLGGAVAVDLAADGGARGLVLESTFSSLPDVASAHAPWLMPQWNMTFRLNSADKIRRYHGPLLQSHGDADHLIPISLARKLYDAAPGLKQFVVIPGADHNDPQSVEYSLALDQFVDSLADADNGELKTGSTLTSGYSDDSGRTLP